MRTKIIAITGPMFGGKTRRIIYAINTAKHANQKVLMVKPDIDTRYNDQIVEREKNEKGEFVASKSVTACTVKSTSEIMDLVQKTRPDVLIIDEAQFFDETIISTLKELRRDPWIRIKKIIVAGLDMDYSENTFGPMPQILAMADTVKKVKAVCFKCGKKAGLTQRIRGSEDTIQVGDAKDYQARCIQCHYIFKPTKNGS